MHPIWRAILFSVLAALIPAAGAQARTTRGPEQATVGPGVAFADNAVASSTVTVTSSFVVSDVDVVVVLHHAYPKDIHLTLRGPDDVIVPLIGDSCGDGSHALPNGTIFGFDDEARTFPSADGPAPTRPIAPPARPIRWSSPPAAA